MTFTLFAAVVQDDAEQEVTCRRFVLPAVPVPEEPPPVLLLDKVLEPFEQHLDEVQQPPPSSESRARRDAGRSTRESAHTKRRRLPHPW